MFWKTAVLETAVLETGVSETAVLGTGVPGSALTETGVEPRILGKIFASFPWTILENSTTITAYGVILK